MNFEVNEINIHSKPVKCLKITGSSIQYRNPAHTIILLDTSGSMNDSRKLQNVKKSLMFLLKFLHKSDYLSLVTFNNISQILIENMNASAEYMEAFRYTIDTLEAEGGTNLSAGLLNVKSILDRVNSSLVSKTGLIILTDGHANEGLVRNDDLLRVIQGIKNVSPNLSITTIGYNEDHNANILKEIATHGGGSYNIVNNIEQVASVFGDILGGLISTVAQNVNVTYPSSWNNLNMYKKTLVNSNTTLSIGDICGESETILLFENSDLSNISVSGVNTNTLETVQTTITWDSSTYSSYKDTYMMAYIRNSVAHILTNLNSMDKEIIKSRLIEMKEYLNTPIVQFNPLTKMLKEEITSIEEQLYSSCIDNTNNLQTSMVLGFGRGLSRHRTTPIRRSSESYDVNDIANIMNNMNMTTPFSNRVQQQLTQQMCSMTADDPK